VVLSGTYDATVDRRQGDLLVLALSSDGTVVEEVAVDPADIPETGRHVGANFVVDLAAGRLVGIEHRSET
jgi:hypothetical protein